MIERTYEYIYELLWPEHSIKQLHLIADLKSLLGRKNASCVWLKLVRFEKVRKPVDRHKRLDDVGGDHTELRVNESH